MSTLRELGAQLRSRRHARGESQEETAAALGVTRQWLARVEAGTGNPDLRQVFALCDHLDLHLTARPSAAQGLATAKKVETTPANPRSKPVAASATTKAARTVNPAAANKPARTTRRARPSPSERMVKTALPTLRRPGADAVPDVDLDRLLAGFKGLEPVHPAPRPNLPP